MFGEITLYYYELWLLLGTLGLNTWCMMMLQRRLYPCQEQ